MGGILSVFPDLLLELQKLPLLNILVPLFIFLFNLFLRGHFLVKFHQLDLVVLFRLQKPVLQLAADLRHVFDEFGVVFLVFLFLSESLAFFLHLLVQPLLLEVLLVFYSVVVGLLGLLKSSPSNLKQPDWPW